jgi:hypothetical protein
VTGRVGLVAMALAGAATAGLAFSTWYEVRTPSGRLAAAGVEAAAELWILPGLGGLIALAALALAVDARRGPAARVLTLAVVVAGALAVGVALESALRPPVGLEVVEAAGRAGRVAPELVGVDVRPGAYLSAAAAAAAAMAGLARLLEETR